MLRNICKSKISNIKVTGAVLHYEGSLTLPSDVIHAADMVPGERIQIVNKNNGNRFETYLIEGENNGEVLLNGPAARLGYPGDEIFVISYAFYSDDEIPEGIKKIKLKEGNKLP